MPVYNPPTYREQCTKVVGFDAATCDYLCDGVADEVQINAAIVAVVALGGGCVALQRGTYVLAASIIMDTEVWLHGSGFDTILRHPGAGGFNMISATTKNNMIISDMYLEGNASAISGINFTTCTYSIIQHVYIHHINDEGIELASSSHYNKIVNCIITDNHDEGIVITSGNYNLIQGNICAACYDGIETAAAAAAYALISGNICYNSGHNNFTIVGLQNTLNGNIGVGAAQSAVGANFAVNGANCIVAGNFSGVSTSNGSGFTTAAVRTAFINNVSFSDGKNGFTINAADCTLVGCVVYGCGRSGVWLGTAVRINISSNYIDTPDFTGTNAYDGITINGIATDCIVTNNVITNTGAKNVQDGIRILNYANNDNLIMNNRIRGYDVGINIVGNSALRNVVKHNVLLNNTVAFVDAGTDTKLASVIVPFVSGYDPQDSGFLVDGEEDFCLTWTMLPVEVQQVVRAKIYARSVPAETHSMEADFTIYGAADNEAYTTHNGSDASKASTSANFAADDIIYWTLTNAGLLAMVGKDSIQVKVEGAAADGDNCTTNAYFRTVEIEYV